ncbi:MAG: dihydroneopterin aldolase [Bacteroidetes bacterium]|nr:MAG: dihydroneopterin aldolase [Bacteroidota bacterium]
MGLVSLEGLEFFAYHGYYDEEQKVGNKYSVDVTVRADLKAAAVEDELSQTVNYETLYKIVRENMQVRARLLEHIGYEIIQSIFQEFLQVQWVEVSISKFNPPIGGVCKEARVTLTEERPIPQRTPDDRDVKT